MREVKHSCRTQGNQRITRPTQWINRSLFQSPRGEEGVSYQRKQFGMLNQHWREYQSKIWNVTTIYQFKLLYTKFQLTKSSQNQLRKHIDETSDEQLKKKGIVQFSMSEEKRKERSRKTTTPQQKMKALALNNLSMSSRILIMKTKKKRQTKSLKGLNFASIMIKIVPKNYAD